MNRGASRMFVIACIVFDDYVDAEFASASLKILKKQLGWKQEREFKFHRATDEQKSIFFKALKPLNFQVYATVVNKTYITEPSLKKGDSFYQKVILKTLDSISDMREANIYLDGKAGKNYRNRSVAKVRQALNRSTRRMAQLKLEDSKDDILIQLADMVAGSIRAKTDPDKSIKNDYLSSICDKIIQLSSYN